jgi:hypothetical protein
MREQYDGLETYCRALGHPVHFDYCRTAGGALPCARIADCWFERVPIEDFLRTHYSQEELERVFAPRPGKLETIVEIVQRLTEPQPPSSGG